MFKFPSLPLVRYFSLALLTSITTTIGWAETVITAPGASGDDVTFNFGDVPTAADATTTNNAFVIFVTYPSEFPGD